MRCAVTLLIITILFGSAAAACAEAFADPAFERVWNITDAAVARGSTDVAWLWGPEPWATLREPYAEAPDGQRLVQYFDKARMELTQPVAGSADLWRVTNGLLPVELITGQAQVGDAQFVEREPARIAAVGDLDNAFPTYADLQRVFTRQGAGDPQGEPITRMLHAGGTIAAYDAYAGDPDTAVVRVVNGHGIPRAFDRFMARRSAAYGEHGALYVFGLPVSGAYWVTVRVNGQAQPVMFQVFERRVLTYTPGNPAAFKVESGNVGQHYYRWRYGDWTRQRFGDQWDIAYPQGWTVNDAGAHAGAIGLHGPYNMHTYDVALFYPILGQPVESLTLDQWVEQELAALTPAQRAAVVVKDITVAGAPARKVVNYPGANGQDGSHRVYIWRAGNKNPRLIIIAQTDGRPFDAGAAEAFLDRFVAEIRP